MSIHRRLVPSASGIDENLRRMTYRSHIPGGLLLGWNYGEIKYC